MDVKERGVWGEEQARKFLEDKGYRTVRTRYFSRYGEIDIIMEDDRYVVFVEVKTRKNANFAQAREFVSKSKQEKIRKTAQMWLLSHDTALQPRFDVLEVYAQQGTKTKNPEIIHLENAF